MAILSPCIISVSDQNGNLINGANVFLNGINVGTTSSGQLTVSISATANTSIQVSLSGYNSYSGTIAPLSTTFSPQLTSIAVVSQPITLVIDTPGAAYTTTGTGEFVDSGSIGTEGSVQTSIAYPVGTYSLSWSFGSSSRTDTLTVVANTSTYTFPPLPVIDTGVNATPVTTASSNPATVTTPNTSTTSTTNYPFTYPAYNYGKYLTPTQAYMYIGDLFIDELTGFQYTLQENKIPTYGYSSSKMDGVGNGKSLIQGQLSINFVSEGYLYTVLSEFVSNTSSNTSASTAAATALFQQYQALSASSSSSAQSQMAAVRTQLNQLLATDPNLPSVLAGAQSQTQSNSPNAVYNRVPFDIVLQFEGGGRTITQKIEKCVLTSNEQILGDNDSTIMDSYGFIARSIGFNSPATTLPKPKGTLSILPGFTPI